jgi:predicted DNA binding CopG/RHH family protein
VKTENKSEEKQSGFSEQDYGEKEGNDMKKKTVYTDAPADIDAALDEAIRIKDFLPSPEELARTETTTSKVTISLTTRSLDLFRRYARKRGARYQTMIRRLIDSYAERTLAGKVK